MNTLPKRMTIAALVGLVAVIGAGPVRAEGPARKAERARFLTLVTLHREAATRPIVAQESKAASHVSAQHLATPGAATHLAARAWRRAPAPKPPTRPSCSRRRA